MKTEISRFCGMCAQALEPLPNALDAAAKKFESRADALGEVLTPLHEIRAHLRSLTDKVRDQQAYLLIFGPLKSGKSTLMNAISGSYVSEVTSLPGYPCLVFVRNSEEPCFSTTRYNGRESVFSDKSLLSEVVADAHRTLVEQIRAAESRGETFDPRSSFPEAIRRIDIQLPVPRLAESSTVLVDTPGLYSRMNFGYDVLTREFRESAACAVFVVKTDNLFLEQVFAEFNQLLGLFSRIFIVVNLDAGKRDLAPDGTLRPSAESEHPERVIEAFTSLSMTGPLRDAYTAGRVRIHAVDLLGAASEFITGSAEPSRHRAAFDAFLQDLTDYLNSSDYTLEFVRDSLRQARNLCGEAAAAASHGAVGELGRQQRERKENMAALNAQIAAVDRLGASDWGRMFHRLHEAHERQVTELIRIRAAAVREEMRTALHAWFEGGESLADLCALHWNGLLVGAELKLADEIRSQFKARVAEENLGLEIPDAVRAEMQTAGFELADIGHGVLSKVKAPVGSALPAASIPAESVPVRKTWVDWLLVRTQRRVCVRVLGPEGASALPAQEKTRRFHEPARAALDAHLARMVSPGVPPAAEKYAADHRLEYARAVAAEIGRRLRASRTALAAELAQLQKLADADGDVLAAAAELEAVSLRAIEAIEALAKEEGVVLGERPPEAGAVAHSEAVPAALSDAEPIPADVPVESAEPNPEILQPEPSQPI
jgi:GTPase SAR1 family protein